MEPCSQVVVCFTHKKTRQLKCQAKKDGHVYKICITAVTTSLSRPDLIAKHSNLGPACDDPSCNRGGGRGNQGWTYALKKQLCCEPTKANPECPKAYREAWLDRKMPNRSSPKTWNEAAQTPMMSF